MYAASVDGSLYGFRHSPLGLPVGNLYIPAVWRGTRAQGVWLYEWGPTVERWLPIQWPSHMWWIRFFLVAHNQAAIACQSRPVLESLRGTRYESIANTQATAHFLRWWLSSTTLRERLTFFENPDVPSLVRSLRRLHSWARGAHCPVHNLLRAYRAIRESHPAILAACAMDAPAALSYSRAYAGMAVRQLADDLCTSEVAHTIDERLFSANLLAQWGVRLDEVLTLPRSTAPVPLQWPLPGRGAMVHRYRELGCSVLDFDTNRYVTLTTVETLWCEFGDALVQLSRRAQVLALDAPAASRRKLYVGRPEGTLWLADGAATAANLHEEVDGGPAADTVTFFLRQGAAKLPAVVVVDGVHRVGLRRQVDLLRRLVAADSVSLVILGGDSAGRLYHRALDGWTVCCHAAQQMGLSYPLDANIDPSRAGLFVLQTTRFTTLPAVHHWVCAPVNNCHLVRWVCQTLDIPRGSVTVANSEPDTRTLAASLPRKGRALAGLSLCDGTVPHIGQELRVTSSIPRRVRFGETLRIMGITAQHGVTVVRCPPKGAQGPAGPPVPLSDSELRTCCRPARLGTLGELGNSHFAERQVVVLLNHGPRSLPPWDPLYIALGLGTATNVTLVANKACFDASNRRMGEVLGAEPPGVPPVWRTLLRTLLTQTK